MAKAPVKIGFWHMMRDVLVTSLNKGQFLPAMLGMIIIVMILKMEPKDVSALAFTTLGMIRNGDLVGWLLLLGSTGGWYVHARFQRRVYTGEVERVAEEKTKLQKNSLGKQAKSSKTWPT